MKIISTTLSSIILVGMLSSVDTAFAQTPLDMGNNSPLGILNIGFELIDASPILFNSGLGIVSAPIPVLESLSMLGLSSGGDIFPVLPVLIESPQEIGDFFLGGGTIINPGMTVFPAIPILTSPFGLQ